MALINEHVVVDYIMQDIDKLLDSVKNLSKEKTCVSRDIKVIIKKRIQENNKN